MPELNMSGMPWDDKQTVSKTFGEMLTLCCNLCGWLVNVCWSVYRARWGRQYTGLSDSDLSTMTGRAAGRAARYRSGRAGSPDKDVIPADFGDSDIESVVSVTSSAFSTQSERPRGSRIIRFVLTQVPTTLLMLVIHLIIGIFESVIRKFISGSIRFS